MNNHLSKDRSLVVVAAVAVDGEIGGGFSVFVSSPFTSRFAAWTDDSPAGFVGGTRASGEIDSDDKVGTLGSIVDDDDGAEALSSSR